MAKLVERLIMMPEFFGKYVLLRRAMRFRDGKAVTSRYGVKMICDSRDATNFYCVSGKPGVCYDDVFDVVSNIPQGAAFLDIGANAGLFSLVAAERLAGSGPVVAFEPSLNTFSKLVANALLNGHRDFYPFCAAVSAVPGVLSFSGALASHSGKAHLCADGPMRVLALDHDALARLLAPIFGDREIYVKIDVEGAELQVIHALAPLFASARVASVIVEVDDQYLARADASAESLYLAMDRYGFDPTIGRGTRSHFNEIFVRRPQVAAAIEAEPLLSALDKRRASPYGAPLHLS